MKKFKEFIEKLKNWYDEGVEKFLFYIGIINLFVFSIIILVTSSSHWKYLVLCIPTIVWVFLRSSRKDMMATANWIAAVFGAIGGAALIILARLFSISL